MNWWARYTTILIVTHRKDVKQSKILHDMYNSYQGISVETNVNVNKINTLPSKDN